MLEVVVVQWPRVDSVCGLVEDWTAHNYSDAMRIQQVSLGLAGMLLSPPAEITAKELAQVQLAAVSHHLQISNHER